MRDVDENAIGRGLELIDRSLARFVSAAKLTPQQADEVCGRIKTNTSLAEAVEGADYVMEAVPEILDLKRDIFKQMDEMA